jgi:hypothetical protein
MVGLTAAWLYTKHFCMTLDDVEAANGNIVCLITLVTAVSVRPLVRSDGYPLFCFIDSAALRWQGGQPIREALHSIMRLTAIDQLFSVYCLTRRVLAIYPIALVITRTNQTSFRSRAFRRDCLLPRTSFRSRERAALRPIAGPGEIVCLMGHDLSTYGDECI